MPMLLLVLLLVLLPAGVQARPFNSDEMEAARIAQNYWGEQPRQCNAIEFEAQPKSVLDGDVGWAFGCHIWIADDIGIWLNICTAITHEYGHLLRGSRHDPQPGTIMSESPYPTEACDAEDDRRRTAYARRTYRKQRARCARRRTGKKRCLRRARQTLKANLDFLVR